MEPLKNLYRSLNSQIIQARPEGFKFASNPKLEFTQEREIDVVHAYLLNRRGKLFHTDNSQEPNQSTASIALISLLRYGLCTFLPNDTLLSLSMVSKLMWNLASPHISAKLFWEPAFPPTEDIPRVAKVAFDTYYIPIANSHRIHRITLTRKHISDPSIFACFVDGELVYLAEKQYDQTFNRILFNNLSRWDFVYTQNYSPFTTAMFTLQGTKVLIDHNNFADLYSAYNPSRFYLFINDVCTATGKTMKEHHKRAISRAYLILFMLILFAPIVCLWLIVANFLVRPIRKRTATTACAVSKYWLPPGAKRHIHLHEKQLFMNTVITESKGEYMV